MSTSQNETLRDIAQLAFDRHQVKGRGMERLAESGGKWISRSTFDRIYAGTYRSRPTTETLVALAYLANVSEERVYKAAGRKYESRKFADDLPDEIDNLTGEQREALLSTARAFLNANREIERLHNELEEQQEDTGHVVQGRFAQQDPVPEQKMPAFEDLAAHPRMKLARDAEDERFDRLGEESQDV